MLEIWDDPGGSGVEPPAFDPEIYAFVVKNTALAARAEAKAAGIEIQIAEGASRPENRTWQERLFTAGVAPYIDVLPLRIAAGSGRAEIAALLGSLLELAADHPPVPKTWTYLEPGTVGAQSALREAVEAAAAGAEVAIARAPSDPEALDGQMRTLYGIHRILGAGYGRRRASCSPIPRGAAPGPGLSGAVNEEDLSIGIAYAGPEGTVEATEGILCSTRRATRCARPRTGSSGRPRKALPAGPRRASRSRAHGAPLPEGRRPARSPNE